MGESLTQLLYETWETKVQPRGPVISGAVFGAGWWFFVDAVVAASGHVGLPYYIPGIVATLALILINSVRR
jgi:hypothetical protein